MILCDKEQNSHHEYANTFALNKYANLVVVFWFILFHTSGFQHQMDWDKINQPRLILHISNIHKVIFMI